MASAGRVLLIPKGTWISGASYSTLDVVYYEGASYVAKGAVSGTTPPVYDTDNWQIMCSGLEIYQNAGAHNAIYRGKNLGSAVTDAQWDGIGNGTFEDLYIGDFWNINDINWRIAAFNYYLNTGDVACTTPHVVIVPDTILYKHAMNDTDTTAGAYVGSKMYTNGLTQAKTMINSAFGEAHVLKHRNFLKNAATDGYEHAGIFYDSTVELMTEQNAFGGMLFGNGVNGTAIAARFTVDKSQFPLFFFRSDLIHSNTFIWLRDIADKISFSGIGANGAVGYGNAAAVNGVRPAFCICKQNAA